MIVYTKGGRVVKQILTKARNVTIDSEGDNDVKISKQLILHNLYNNPELLDQIYVEGSKIMIILQDRIQPINIGILHGKYEDIYNDRKYSLYIKSWQVTGGWDMPKIEEGSTIKRKAFYGLNLDIDVRKSATVI